MQVSKDKKKYLFLIIIFLSFTTFNQNQKNNYPIFQIKEVVFLNSINFEENIKNNIKEILINKSLLNLNNKKITLLFAESKWIKSYKIKKKYPNTIFIELKEHEVVAIKKKGDKYFLINDSFLLTNKTVNKVQSLNFIHFSGIYSSEDLKNFYTTLSKSVFFKDVENVKFKNLRRIELYLKNKTLVKLGNYELQDQFKIVENIINKNFSLELIDLRNQGTIIIK